MTPESLCLPNLTRTFFQERVVVCYLSAFSCTGAIVLTEPGLERRGNHLKRLKNFRTADSSSHGQSLSLTGSFVTKLLDSGDPLNPSALYRADGTERAVQGHVLPAVVLAKSNVNPPPRKVNKRLPKKRNSNFHGARPVHLIITMIKWIRTSRLSMKNFLSCLPFGVSQCKPYFIACTSQHPVLPSVPPRRITSACQTFKCV